MTRPLQSADIRPLLILAHDGIDLARMSALPDAVDGCWMTQGHDDALAALAESWTILNSYQPLQGHRAAGRKLGPEQPWFGAERTNPDAYLQRMGPAILPGIVSPPPGTRVAGIVSRRIFWAQDQALALCDFFLGAMANGLILLPSATGDEVVETFAAVSDWRPEAARQAIDTMAQMAEVIAQAYPGRALHWALDAEAPLPGGLLGALGLEAA